MTAKTKQDGQKQKVKARLVARGFQENDKVQSDSPTANRESFKIFLHVCANMRIEKLRVIDITAAYLQSDDLQRDVFIKMPKDVRCDGKVAKLVKPLYGLTDSGRRFFCTMRRILLEGGFQVQGILRHISRGKMENWSVW